MSENSVPRLAIVRREEKETKLKEFILGHLAARSVNAAGFDAFPSCLLVARSAESPVAKTVLALGARASLRGFSVRAIFACLGTAETARVAEACRVSDWGLQIRWARDIRLLDAHEQLVLGPSTAWIGDCMRREPSSRDASELFASDCPEAARRASMYFERLWRVCEPIFERQAPALSGIEQTLPVQPIEPIGRGDDTGKTPFRRTSP
jgi:hypothetical protein